MVQNLSSDVIGVASAAIIEGQETCTRKGQVKVNLGRACRILTQGEPLETRESSVLEIPVTLVVIYV